jgi:5'-methylthioadenosine phosphorylase
MFMTAKIPNARYAIIGGSSTFSIDFPAALCDADVDIIEEGLIFDTPYGNSPPFTLFSLGGKYTLTCKMHGWRSGVTRADASRQIFWVFREAGVEKIFAEGGVGAVNHLLNPRDLVLPTDYIDNSMRKDVNLGSHYLLIMRKAICSNLHEMLLKSAGRYIQNRQVLSRHALSGHEYDGIDSVPENSIDRRHPRIFERGIYAVTDGRHFESPAEVNVLKQWGVDVVGQSICPEVYLAREIGACYAGIYLVVNYAEGVVEDWKHEELSEIFHGESETIGKILLDALRLLDPDGERAYECACADLRKPTLLKETKEPKETG